MELNNRSMQVCRSYYWMRHGAQTRIRNDRSLDMLVITLQKMAVKGGQIHLYRKEKVKCWFYGSFTFRYGRFSTGQDKHQMVHRWYPFLRDTPPPILYLFVIRNSNFTKAIPLVCWFSSCVINANVVQQCGQRGSQFMNWRHTITQQALELRWAD